MKIIINESKLENTLLKYLNMSYEGFEDMDYTWADFDCGWGICCDIYAVGFVLPGKEYDDYSVKLVNSENYDDDGDYPEELTGELPEICEEIPDITDPRFDTLLVNEEITEEIGRYFGDKSIWKTSFLKLFNQIYGTNANDIIIFPIE